MEPLEKTVTQNRILKKLGGDARDFWESATQQYWDAILKTARELGTAAAINEAEEIARDAR